MRQKAVAYVRVSTTDQHLGPDAQRAAIAAYCAREGLDLVSEHADIGVSGGAPLDKRPGLLAALAELGDGDVLIVSRRDRLARDMMVALVVEHEAGKVGARVVCADGAGNGDTPEAALMRGMLDLVAQYERAIIQARIVAALRVKQARGELTGAAPYGQRRAADGVHLEPDPAEAAVVARAARLRAKGLPLRAIASQLEAEGVRSRRGGVLGASQIKKMLDP